MKQNNHTALSHLPVLILFTILAMSVMLVLLTGEDVYQRIARRDDTAYTRRTAAQYLTTRVRQADSSGCIAASPFDGNAGPETLILKEYIDGSAYETRIYCYDGYLRELFCPSGAVFSPGDGEPVIPAQSLDLDLVSNPGSILMELTSEDGTAQTLYLLLRSGKEEAQ